MTDDAKREKSIAELKKLIAEQRARIDPAVLKRAEAAALASKDKLFPPLNTKPAEKAPDPVPADTVPYDREKAAKTVELFLKSHDNAREFQLKLLAKIKKGDH